MAAIPIHTHYINGTWHAARGEDMAVVRNPATEAVVAEVCLGASATVAAACEAAAQALPAWSRTAARRRAALLRRIAEGLEARQEDIALAIAREVGMPLKLARRIQAALPVATFRATAAAVEALPWETAVGHSTVHRVPAGVVAAITPWNMPLHQIAAKVAPALGAGCSVVLKPSELTPTVATVLAEVLAEAGLPPGVCNIVQGTGAQAGAALVRDPHVRLVSFTGSTAVGREIAGAAASRLKRLALELGGKSAAVVLADGDLPAAVRTTVASCFLNSGQTCNALSRLVVPRERLDEACSLLRAEVAGYSLGDPLQAGTRMGPVISPEQRERVLERIDGALSAGARRVAGGGTVPDRGYFVAPTVLAGMAAGDPIAQEEVFGPVLCILGAGDDAEAIRIANGTRYGLAAAVWTADARRAHEVARSLVAGQVDINGARFNPQAPFGGFRASGYGRELGAFALEEYLELQAVQR